MKREENKLGQIKPENIIWKYELFAMNRTEKKQTMKINQKEIKPLELWEIYDNYFDYLKPIMEYYVDVCGHINSINKLEDFIDNIAINGYGFAKYNGKLYIIELVEDNEQLIDHNYFIEGKDKYVLEPINE